MATCWDENYVKCFSFFKREEWATVWTKWNQTLNSVNNSVSQIWDSFRLSFFNWLGPYLWAGFICRKHWMFSTFHCTALHSTPLLLLFLVVIPWLWHLQNFRAFWNWVILSLMASPQQLESCHTVPSLSCSSRPLVPSKTVTLGDSYTTKFSCQLKVQPWSPLEHSCSVCCLL